MVSQAASSVTCPYCHAEPGEGCHLVRPTELRPLKGYHVERRHLAVEAQPSAQELLIQRAIAQVKATWVGDPADRDDLLETLQDALVGGT